MIRGIQRGEWGKSFDEQPKRGGQMQNSKEMYKGGEMALRRGP